jgi:hypothetical protein
LKELLEGHPECTTSLCIIKEVLTSWTGKYILKALVLYVQSLQELRREPSDEDEDEDEDEDSEGDEDDESAENREIIEWLEKLERIDPMRKGRYADLGMPS